MINQLSVKEKILFYAKQEFLIHGFKDASLRNISAAAGMTTGAIYTYFKDKNALFEAIVDPVYYDLDLIFKKISSSYYDSDKVISEITLEKSLDDFNLVYDFIYENFEAFKLLVTGAEGSSRADFIHVIVEKEVKHTLAYLEKMFENNYIKRIDLNAAIIRTISESYINAILEPIRYNMSREEALKNLEVWVIFYTGGWQSLFNEILKTE